MKVMIFHPPGRGDPSRIKSFGGVWAYYLERELGKLGVEVVPIKWMRQKGLSNEELIRYHQELDLTGIDHVLGLGIRYWSFLPPECGLALRARMGRHQSLAQVHDVTLLDKTPADVTFAHSTALPPGNKKLIAERYDQYTCHVGWAADSELCRPEQPQDELQILVDHPTFTASSPDVTLSILLNLRELVNKPQLWSHRYKGIRVRQMVDGAVVDVDVNGEINVKPYERVGIPYTEACAEYSKAHVFIVTHCESVGQTVIETATAGALILCFRDFIPEDRLATVRNYQWTRFIKWQQVLDQIDVQASRAMAMENSWTNIAKRMVEYFERFDRTKMGWPQ